MSQLAAVARLKPGTEAQVAQLLRQGPRFDSGGRGLQRHAVYLSATEVVFIFEGPDARLSGASRRIQEALDEGVAHELGPARVAEEADTWSRGDVLSPTSVVTVP